jgi:PAS domain S-box-containing protein
LGVAGPRSRSTEENRLRDAIGQVALQMAEQLDWDKSVETVLHVTSTALGADAAIIWNVDSDARLLQLAASWGIPEPRLRPLRQLPFDSPLTVARAVHEGRVQVVERLDELPVEDPIHQQWTGLGFQSVMALPLRSRGRLVGAMTYLTRSTRHYRKAELACLQTIADIIGSGLEKAWLHTQLEAASLQARRLAEEARAATCTLLALIDTMPAGVVVVDRAGDIDLSNAAAREMLGGEVTGNAFGPHGRYTFHHLDGSPFPLEERPLHRALEVGEAIKNVEVLVRREDGTESVILTGSAPVRDGQGNVARAVSVFLDVTEQKKAEEGRVRLAQEQAARAEIEAHARKLEIVIQAVPDAVIVADRQGNIMTANDAFVKLIGLADQREALKPLAEHWASTPVLAMDGRPLSIEESPTLRALRGETVMLREARVRLKDGTERLLEVSAAPVFNERGEVIHSVTVLRDVTERRRWQRQRDLLARVGQALSRTLELKAVLQTVMEETLQGLGADGVAIFLPSPDRLQLQLAASRGFRQETEELLRHIPMDRSLAAVRAFETGQIQIIEDMEQASRDSEWIRAVADAEGVNSVIAIPLRAAGGTIGIMTFISRAPRHFMPDELDTIARVAELFAMAIENACLFEEAERRADSLHELQEQRSKYILGISHGLRTPLTAIQGQAQLLLRSLEKAGLNGRLQHSAETVVASSRRMSVMLRDLVDLMHLEARQRLRLNLEPIDLPSFITDVIGKLDGVVEASRVKIEAPESLPRVQADPDRLERILINLLSNALEYSDPGTEVTVRLEQRDGEVVTSINDRGRGIPAEQLGSLFQPYRRLEETRRHRESLGLGLYVTKGLVEAHGGRIRAESEVGKGSSFIFSLPAIQPSAQ